jgi:hypothetical protein
MVFFIFKTFSCSKLFFDKNSLKETNQNSKRRKDGSVRENYDVILSEFGDLVKIFCTV